MRRMLRRAGLFFLLLAVAAAVSDARGVTLYVGRVVVADRGAVTVGDLVQPVGDLPAQAGETLALTVASITDRLLYIPSRSYADSLESGFGMDAIIVGSRSIVVPRGAVPPEQLGLVDKVTDFLSAQGILGADRAEMDFRVTQLRGAISADSSLTFQLTRSTRGSVEVSFSAGAGDSAASGRVLLTMSGAGAPDIRASDPVRVVFHKGLITIEMDGKALTAAAVGDVVKVQVPDSQKSFSGRLAAGKAVNVDLP